MAVRTKRFDPVDDLTTDEALAEYVSAALGLRLTASARDSGTGRRRKRAA